MLLRVLTLACLAQWLLVTGEDEKTMVTRMKEKCREENQLREDEIENVKDVTEMDTPDERVKCFMKCMLTNLGMMNEAGDLTLEGSSESYLACKDVTGTNPCEKALSFHHCLRREKARRGETIE